MSSLCCKRNQQFTIIFKSADTVSQMWPHFKLRMERTLVYSAHRYTGGLRNLLLYAALWRLVGRNIILYLSVRRGGGGCVFYQTIISIPVYSGPLVFLFNQFIFGIFYLKFSTFLVLTAAVLNETVFYLFCQNPSLYLVDWWLIIIRAAFGKLSSHWSSKHTEMKNVSNVKTRTINIHKQRYEVCNVYVTKQNVTEIILKQGHHINCYSETEMT